MIYKNYLETAQDVFGEMFDYAINDCKIDVLKFQKLFLKSEILKRLEENDMLLISGHSGVELADMFIPKIKQTEPSYPTAYRSVEYWAGWSLAYLWISSIYTFENIFEKVPLLDICRMYSPYHEMDITHFYDHMLFILETNNLQEFRKKANLSQSELSLLSNVSIKTIQKYERKERLLSNASGDILLRLSRALNCSIESLII